MIITTTSIPALLSPNKYGPLSKPMKVFNLSDISGELVALQSPPFKLYCTQTT